MVTAAAELPGTKEMQLTVVKALDPQTQMLRDLAADPNFDVSKLQAMVQMIERAQDRAAEQQFNAAFAQMQPRIPIITELSKTNMGTYAPREDIVEIVTPILAEFGFALSFKTKWPEGKILIIGKLKHIGGHCEESEFLTDADKSGSKNDVQARGSAVEYGRRYTTTDLLNIATRKADDDGRRAAAKPAPDGYDKWLAHIDELVSKGATREQLNAAWEASDPLFRNYLSGNERHKLEDWKKKAKAVARG